MSNESIIYDLLVMQPILRMVGLMNVFNDRFGRYNCLNAKQQKATQLAAMRHNGTLRIEMILVHGIMLASCVALYAHGKISLGDIWTYDLLMSQLIGGVNRLFEVMPQLDQGCESAKSLEEFFAIPEENDKQLVAEVLNGEIAICMQNVSFSYCNRANNTISHCNVTIKKGEAVCLMGRNGVGKSTFINLMVGILKPTSGKIDIGFSTPAVVPQRISIFRESILENVRLYDQSICAKKVRAVLGKCGMGKWLSNQRLGVYEKIIPENLSGGEIQRLAIARSMIRNPDLLILDEITNNLDLLEKQRITKILQSLKGKCTLVVISHDLDMLCLFDKVLVFNMGVIHEVAPNSDQNVYEKVRVMIGE